MDSIKAPSCPLGEFTQAEPHCQHQPSKPGRWGRFPYWYFFTGWPFYNLSTQTSLSCPIWLNWPEQWCLENYCGSDSLAGALSCEGTINQIIWGLFWKNKHIFLGDFHHRHCFHWSVVGLPMWSWMSCYIYTVCVFYETLQSYNQTPSCVDKFFTKQ